MRVSGQVTFGKKVMPQPGIVIVTEPIAPIVTMTSELGLTWLRLKTAIAGMKAEVPATDIDRSGREIQAPFIAPPFPQRNTLANDTAAVSIGAVKPTIQAVIKAI